MLLVDDQTLVRQAFALMLSVEDDIELVGQCANGAEALAMAHTADIVLMDIEMPVMNGVEATRRIRAANLAEVIMLTTFDRDDYLFEALRCGAAGFLLKNAEPEKLLESIRVVAGGGALLAPEVTRRVIEGAVHGARTAPAPSPGLARLTERERGVLVLMARGLSNAEIAARLVVGDATVKTHVSSCLSKLGVRDRVQAVIHAYEHGLISPTIDR
ncbi:DNA-binding response regulator [Tessaracoccus antarcticus]|uniref:DNA-binding response regulator n=1 Tax=Tessaracoccus antarcticus TaxID=2479848 RepID=A0A3M0G6W9_9ACTN|nr:DNA-binding response regulator [Tessaracoccus antarcticus]